MFPLENVARKSSKSSDLIHNPGITKSPLKRPGDIATFKAHLVYGGQYLPHCDWGYPFYRFHGFMVSWMTGGYWGIGYPKISGNLGILELLQLVPQRPLIFLDSYRFLIVYGTLMQERKHHLQ